MLSSTAILSYTVSLRPAWNTCNRVSKRNRDRHREKVKRLRRKLYASLAYIANIPLWREGTERQTAWREAGKTLVTAQCTKARIWIANDSHTLWLDLIHISFRFQAPLHCSELYLLTALCQLVFFP